MLDRVMQIVKQFFTNPKVRLGYLSKIGFYNLMSNEKYLKKCFKCYLGYPLNLDNPRTFNEKLQWLKLYHRNSQYTTMVDKVAAKEYVANQIGQEYIVPNIDVWNSPEAIDFDKLPEQFVLKCNHNSGEGMYICTDKSNMNIDKVRRNLRKGYRENYYLRGREWPYKNVPRQILAEVLLQPEDGEIKDYKFMCFNGKVKCSFVCSERFSNEGLRVTFFDRDWNIMPFERLFPKSAQPIPKPYNYEKMIELAEVLAKDIPFVRVDFYEVNKKIYFGELTLSPGNGFEGFTPLEWDYKLGSWIELPEKQE